VTGYVLRSSRTLRLASDLVNKSIPFYIANAALPPLLLLLIARINDSLAYATLWPLTAYFAACVAATLLLLIGRGSLMEYSLDSARKLLLVAGALGLLTGLVVGGLLVLRARAMISGVTGAERVKKR